MATRNPYAEHKPTGGSGGYLKFENDKTYRLKIVSDPAIFDSMYKGSRSTKYGFLVYNIDDEEGQIMQLPKGGYLALASVAQDPDYGNPAENDYFVKITRTGKEFQTKYNVVPVAKAVDIPEEIKDQLAEIDLIARLDASENNLNVAWVLDDVDGKRSTNQQPQTKDVVIDDIGDEPINLDDLPM